MALNRRDVLKAFSWATALPLTRLLEATSLLPRTSTSIYVLFHGMFFMEFSGKQLYVATPEHAEHHFCLRRGTGKLQKLSKDINLVGALTAGSATAFPPDVPQFSKSLIGDYGPITAQLYRCKIILPLPKSIFGYRTDVKDHFNPVPSSTIGQAILASTEPRLATITCLEYDGGSDAPYVDSYFAQHKTRPTPAQVNAALMSARQICGNSFDLQFPDHGMPWPLAPKDSQSSLPGDVTPDEESELEEILKPGELACDELPSQKRHSETSAKAADVASCPQFGITSP